MGMQTWSARVGRLVKALLVAPVTGCRARLYASGSFPAGTLKIDLHLEYLHFRHFRRATVVATPWPEGSRPLAAAVSIDEAVTLEKKGPTKKKKGKEVVHKEAKKTAAKKKGTKTKDNGAANGAALEDPASGVASLSGGEEAPESAERLLPPGITGLTSNTCASISGQDEPTAVEEAAVLESDSLPAVSGSADCEPQTPSALATLCKGSLPDWLVRRAEHLGYGTPTSAQEEALPVVLKGKDCVLHAQTGSGKTLVYLLPILSGINPQRSAVQAVVVVPTRELGIQVARVARQLAGKGEDHVSEETANTKKAKSEKIQVMALLDGADGNRQKIWLKADPPHIVVGTPDRIHKMVELRNLRLNALKYVVVDEFDAYPAAIRTSGSLSKLLTVDSNANQRQTILASATVPQQNRTLSDLVRNKWAKSDLVHLHVDPIQHVPKFLEHRYLVCESAERIGALQRLIQRDQPSAAIIFANDLTERNKQLGEDASVASVAEALSEGQPEGLRPLLLQENARVQTRASIVQEMREGHRRLLVATDLAARGLDLPEVSHVYNFDLPQDATSYVHRAGRTGRRPIAGTKGTVTCLVSSKEVFALKRLLNAVRVEAEEVRDT